MKNITILAFDTTPLSSIALPADIFNAAGTFWNRLFQEPPNPQFKVTIATLDGKPVRCNQSISITPDCRIEDGPPPELLVVSPVTNLKSRLLTDQDLLQLLTSYHSEGTKLASICTGAFFLAAAGLLDGRKATTHWGLASVFKRWFPKVNLQTEHTVTDDDTIFCSGGASAGADLALYLVRKYCGSEIAHRCARSLLIDPSRQTQSPYEIFTFSKNHDDPEILHAQRWLEQNYDKPLMVSTIAEKVAMSRRTFERRFKKATGDSPNKYLQRIRVENARLLLEKGKSTFEEITFQSGYEDPSTFRKVFHKATGLSPGSYREKFRV